MLLLNLYLRNLKAIFNLAIKEGFISERFYPFRNFSIGTTAKSKEVLYPNQLKALWEYEPVGIRETRAKSYFFFSYLCNGINFKDVVHLKKSDIKGDTLNFIREKTKNSNTVANKKIQVHLHPEILKIINLLGNNTNLSTDYLFPVLNDVRNNN
ncbi:MAG: hypothetical protein WKF59_20495 [Chitinophagaceae bacterium]